MRGERFHYAIQDCGPWVSWRAWYPVKIGTRWLWWRTVEMRRWAVTCDGRFLGSGRDYRQALQPPQVDSDRSGEESNV